MLRKNPSGHTPVVSTKAYIDPTAVICGRVIIHDYVYVGPYAVIRADELNADGDMDPIIIHSHSKEGANKQVISSQADSLIKISRIWADFFPANTSNQPI